MSDSHSGAAEDSDLLGCDAVSGDNTFLRKDGKNSKKFFTSPCRLRLAVRLHNDYVLHGRLNEKQYRTFDNLIYALPEVPI
jgi:hypothetical protein